MTITPTSMLLSAVVALTAFGLGGCGGSDEDDVRAAYKGFEQSLASKQAAERTCDLMTPRAQAQITAFFSGIVGGGSCVSVFKNTTRGEEAGDSGFPHSKTAKIEVRDDRAVLKGDSKSPQNLGMRKVDGDWKVDNIFGASLDERPRRFDPRLAKGTDEQQVRATVAAIRTAVAKKDYERACDLFGDGAQAQVLVAVIFTSFGGTEPNACARAFGELAKRGDAEDAFAAIDASAAKVDAAEVSIKGDRAVVKIAGEGPESMVRVDGHWLADGEPISVSKPATAAELKRCWRRAGAMIASSARDLGFASPDEVRGTTVKPDRTSVKGDDWRIFYSLSAEGSFYLLEAILAKPSSALVVAYVKDAPAHADIVAKARECGA